MAEENWWDKFTTGLGDVLIAPQQPWGTLIPGMPAPTPAQRAHMISSTLMALGGALSQGARQRLPIGESLAAGWQAAQQGGAQRGQQQLQGMLVAGKLGDAKRKNETIEKLGRIKPPPGVDPEVWRGMVAIDPGRAFQLYIKAAAAERVARADGGGGTDAGSAGGGTDPGVGARPVQGGAARAFQPTPPQPGSVAGGSVAGSIAPLTGETAELPPSNVPAPNVGQPGWRPPAAPPVAAGDPSPAQPQATLPPALPRAGTMAVRAQAIPATPARTSAIDPRQLLPQAVPIGQILMDKAGNRYARDPRDGRWRDVKTGKVYVPDVRPGPVPTR